MREGVLSTNLSRREMSRRLAELGTPASRHTVRNLLKTQDLGQRKVRKQKTLGTRPDRDYQFWQEGSHAELIFSKAVMWEKLEYIHQNPLKRGYVDLPEHWRYSSAQNYQGQPGLTGIDQLS